MALSTMTVAPWTILSSRAAIASGRCFPSAFGMYVRRDGCGRYVPRWTRSCFPEPGLKVGLVVLPRHAIHAGGGFAPKRIERRLECIDSDMVEKCGEPFLLLQPCSFPYAVQRLGHASPVLCPVRALLALVPLGPRPWLTPAPSPVARLCSTASQLLCRSQTSLDRASAATAPRLPAADQAAQ